MLLEVIVESVADARAAEAGGADRLEVVRALDREGLTPSFDLVRAIAAEVRLPLRVMVRESDGFSILHPHELTLLQRAAETFARLGVDGVVLGFAREGQLDLDAVRAVLSAAAGALRATCHRAFDAASDPLAAIDALRLVDGVDRILTTGGDGDWAVRGRRLAEYVARATPEIEILAGGGVDVAAARLLAASGCVREIHVGRAAREGSDVRGPVSSARVRELKGAAERHV